MAASPPWQSLLRVTRRVRSCLLLAVLANLAVIPAYALTGTDVAAFVNTRYNNTRAKCAVDKPAYFCSGLIVRPLNGASGTAFWVPTAAESAAQSMAFVYLRHDIEVSRLPSSAGFILNDYLSAAGQLKSMDIRCIYPLDDPVNGSAGDLGCNLFGGNTGAADLNSCDAQGVADVADWMQHLAANRRQCSFSTTIASKFYTALQAHKAYAAPTRLPTLLIAPWTNDAPRSVPVEAFYFDVSNGGQLAQAQQYQRAYFTATGEWVPILRMSFGAGGQAMFGFAEDDQLDVGFATADELNRRFNDTRRECPGAKAALYCSGVIIRGNARVNPWNPTPDAVAKNGVSTSFLRADANFYTPFTLAGMVFRDLDAPTAYPLRPRCIYPPDGNLHLRANGCGPSSVGAPSGPCAAIGVNTLAQWRAHYAVYGTRGQCSLAITVDAFEISLQARQFFTRPMAGYEGRNELVIEPWPQNIPGAIPLQAFFFVDNGLVIAQSHQRAYYAATGRFLPIVRLQNPVPTAGTIFTYRIEDQTTLTGP